jgi:hypothetical protein
MKNTCPLVFDAVLSGSMTEDHSVISEWYWTCIQVFRKTAEIHGAVFAWLITHTEKKNKWIGWMVSEKCALYKVMY